VNITLSGRAAIVTGAARGIGFAIAQKLAGAGASVVLTDVDGEALERARAQIEKSASGKAAAVAGDLTGADFPQTVVDKALDTFGSVDILVNNAGYTWDNVIQKTTDEQFQAMLDIHIVKKRRTRVSASRARWSTSLPSPEPTATPGRRATLPARRPSSD